MERPATSHRPHKWKFIKYVPILPAVAGMCFIILFAVLAVIRMQYPFELEWMEGAVADHVGWILSGHSLYAAPTVDFVAFRYTPLYYYAGAALSTILGQTLVPLRLISILSTLGALWLVFLFVHRETGDRRAGIAAAGMFAACFPLTGSFFDLARVDSLFLLLTLGGIYLQRVGRSLRSGAVVGLLFALAFFTKQTAGPVAALFILYELTVHFRRAVVIGLTALGLVGAVTLIWDSLSDGWYTFYTLALGKNIYATEDLPSSLYQVFVGDYLRMFPLVMLIGTILPVIEWLAGRRREALYYGVLWISLTSISFLARIHPGGWTNTLIPGAAAIIILFGVGYVRFSRWTAGGSRFHRGLGAGIVCLVLGQFALLVYAPIRHIPSEADRQAGYDLIARIKEIDGDVLIPYHGYLGRLAGKPIHSHFQATRDLMADHTHDEEKAALTLSIRNALYRHRFAALILDRDWYAANVEECYTPAGSLFVRPDVFYPVAGWLVRPQQLYVPRTADINHRSQP